MYEIILSKRVEKFLDKLNSKDRERIILSLDKLRIRPDAHLKRLVGNRSYKFRVGNYRLIVDMENDKLLVLVVDIGHRKNIYKKRA
jgi:mRNA interferase RelE/StbE